MRGEEKEYGVSSFPGSWTYYIVLFVRGMAKTCLLFWFIVVYYLVCLLYTKTKQSTDFVLKVTRS